MLRYYNVFHISQVDGVEPLEKPELLLRSYWERGGINVEPVAGNRAYYSPASDSICLPLFERFISSEEYYGTAAHESVHSTLKASRCSREEERCEKIVAFGSEEYNKEELMAEIGSASLLNIVGIDTEKTFKNNVAYIQSWIKVLQNDVKFIISAAGKAEKAVNYIMGEV